MRGGRAVVSEASEPLLVDERTAARLLGGLSVRSLFNLRQREGLPFVRIGARVMYCPADLAAWIESRREGGNDDR